MIKRGLVFFKAAAIMLLLFSAVSLSHADEKAGAENPESYFYKGNINYEAGKYDEAIAEYSKALTHGVESGSIYFNIGNSYFKKGNLGKAILNYERAKRLIPYDSDLVSNYNYALSKIKKRPPETKEGIIMKGLNIFRGLSINSLTLLLSAVYTVCILLLILSVFFRNYKKQSLTVMAILLVIFITAAASLYRRVSLIDKEAVIVSEETDARFEPLDEATAHFTLYEGMKVQVLQSKHEWMKIRRPDGKAGWVVIKSIEII